MRKHRRPLVMISALVMVLTAMVNLRPAAKAQDFPSTEPNASAPPAPEAIPRLIKFSGALGPQIEEMVSSEAASTSRSLTMDFLLYESQEGGSPLWSETQNVEVDEQGHYTVLLGAASPQGLPLELFTTGKARWLGAQPQLAGIDEQPRILLVGVPYALKAADANTLGGLPPSAFLRSGTQPASGANAGGAAGGNSNVAAAHGAVQANAAGGSQGTTGSGSKRSPLPGTASHSVPLTACTAVTSSGNAGTNRVARFTAPCTIEQTGIVESNGKLQFLALGTATAAAGFSSEAADLAASAFNRSNKAAVAEHFLLQAEPLGNNTTNPSGRLSLLFAAGGALPVETGLTISSRGLLTFAPGQSFPGYAKLVASNVFTGNETINGNLTVPGGGNVAIGSTFAQAKLDVEGGDILAGNNLVVVGNVGIGTTNALTKLDVEGGDIRAGNNLVALGNVGIGTTNATAKLDVAGGNILARNSLAVGKNMFVSGNVGMGSGSLFFPLDVGTGDNVAIHATNNSDFSPALSVTNFTPDNNCPGCPNTGATYIAKFLAPNTPRGTTSVNGCTITTTGDLLCTGEVVGNIAIPGAAAQVAQTGIHTVQALESWLEDFGSGKLVNGVASVALDAMFARTVNTSSYHLFLTPKGDCKGLFVAHESPKGFEVRELGGGRSGVEFDYRIVAHRKGFERVRLAVNR